MGKQFKISFAATAFLMLSFAILTFSCEKDNIPDDCVECTSCDDATLERFYCLEDYADQVAFDAIVAMNVSDSNCTCAKD